MPDNISFPHWTVNVGDPYEIAAKDIGGFLHINVLTSAADGPANDAFGRHRVSEPTTIFASKLVDSMEEALFWDSQLISGTMALTVPTSAKPYIDFTSTDTTAGKRTRQTFRCFNYQPGKSQMILMTGVLELASGTKTGCVREIGLFNDDNGVFFESDAGVVGVTVRSNDSGTPDDTTVIQSAWNIDTFDGSGGASNPSGLTLDVTKAQIFIIDFQWLSIGRVRFGFEIDGRVCYAHSHNSANASNIPWASTPNLPLRYQIETTTSSGVCSMRCICASVVSEGGTDSIGITRYRSTEGAAVTCTTDNIIYAIVGVKLKAASLGANVQMLSAALQIQSASDSGEWILMFNPTVAGTFAYADLTDSVVQTAIGATANTVTDGTQVGGGFASSSGVSGGSRGNAESELDSALKLGANIAGTPDEIVLCFRTNAGTASPAVEGALTWKEIS